MGPNQHDLEDQLHTANSLAELPETTDASLSTQAEALIKHRWDRDTLHDRAVEIIRAERERVDFIILSGNGYYT
ncbi:hypothetical protein [Haloquadratum walsbyi]|uniref:Uncharacterized protein n=1 Tax=Haloquadratum walsbyi J07HQW2 TaxID=1238425 RepID=U1PPF2_9EURY|nr:hypothetical protein [Haloquadratum walsbyi]ERG94181.1 MAG: hypothetical protein J07HQW2_00615 [Haloquadratum walsbyi J07HQW2]